MVNIVDKLKKYKIYLLELLTLAMPLIVGNLGQTLIGITDVFVAAKYSIDALAAVAIANSIIFTIFIVGLGFLASISIILSNYRGAKIQTKKYFNVSILFSVILSVIFGILTLLMVPLVDKFGFPVALVPYIKQYMFISAFSYLGMYVYQAIKEFLQAHEIVFFPNVVLMIAVLINLICNFVFVFGFGVIPPMGVKGLAIATLTSRSLMGIILVFYCFKMFYSKKQIYEFSYIKKLLKLGYPIGITLLVEFMAFNLVTILVGRIDGILSATHNIVLNVAGSTFMIPLALSNAMAIKIGYYNGAKNYEEIKRYSIVGLSVSMLFMVCCAFILFAFPSEIIGIFTDNPQILKIGVPIVIVAAFFQIFDGLQVSASGILKGLKLTKIVSKCVFAGYWVLGLPLGYILAFKCGYNLLGFWIGLAFSLFVIGTFEAIIIYVKLKKLKKVYC